MHPIPIHAPWLLLASALLFSACSGGSKASPRTGALTLSATTADPTSGPVVIPLGIPLGSGQLAIDSALLHVGDLEIEMRRGRRHSQRGAGGVHAVEDEGEGHENEGVACSRAPVCPSRKDS